MPDRNRHWAPLAYQHAREDRMMVESAYDETRARARLPNLDIEILHRRPWEGNEEHLMVTLRAVPSFEAFGRLLEASNPLLSWTRMMEAAWLPWARGLYAPFTQPLEISR